VLGGGSNPGAHEIGDAAGAVRGRDSPGPGSRYLGRRVNAALVAAFPGAAAVDRHVAVWNGLARTGVFGAFLFDRIGTAIRTGTHLYSSVPLRALLESSMPARRIEDLEMPFQCVAASIEPCEGACCPTGEVNGLGDGPGRGW